MEVLTKYHRRDEFRMSSGKKIFIEVKLVKLSIAKPEFPQGYKFSWIAFNRDYPNERVLFDNHRGKKPHYHVNGKQVFFTWKSRQHAEQLFYQKIIEKFGHFQLKIS